MSGMTDSVIFKNINCLNFLRVLEDILEVKKNATLIKMMKPQLDLTFKNPSFQNGRCVNLGPSIRNGNITWDSLVFSVLSEKIPETYKNVRVLLQDPISGGDILPIVFEMKGDSIKIETKPEKKYRRYQTKISISKHVKGDPKYDCENYSEGSTYGKCIETELVTKIHELIGCHPPLISDKREGICNETFSLSRQKDDAVGKIVKLLKSILNDFESESCKPPCTKYEFETKLLYDTQWRNNENAISILFSKKVELTKTSFLIGIPHFLTGLGGAISGGRTLLWFICSAFCIAKIIEGMKKL